MFRPLTPQVAALLSDGITVDTTYGNDTGPSVGIVDSDGCDVLRLFQPEEDGWGDEIAPPWFSVQVDASNERGMHDELYDGPDEGEAVRVYVEARDRYVAWGAVATARLKAKVDAATWAVFADRLVPEVFCMACERTARWADCCCPHCGSEDGTEVSR